MSTFIGMGVNKATDKKAANVTKLEKENKKLSDEVKELTEEVASLKATNATLTSEKETLEVQVKELTATKNNKNKEE